PACYRRRARLLALVGRGRAAPNTPANSGGRARQGRASLCGEPIGKQNLPARHFFLDMRQGKAERGREIGANPSKWLKPSIELRQRAIALRRANKLPQAG